MLLNMFYRQLKIGTWSYACLTSEYPSRMSTIHDIYYQRFPRPQHCPCTMSETMTSIGRFRRCTGAALRHSSALYTVDLWLCHGGHQFYFLTVLLNWYSFTTRCQWRVVHLIPAQYARLYATFIGPSTSCNRNYYPHPHHGSYDMSKTLTSNPNHFWSYFLPLVRLAPRWIENDWAQSTNSVNLTDRQSDFHRPSECECSHTILGYAPVDKKIDSKKWRGIMGCHPRIYRVRRHDAMCQRIRASTERLHDVAFGLAAQQAPATDIINLNISITSFQLLTPKHLVI